MTALPWKLALMVLSTLRIVFLFFLPENNLRKALVSFIGVLCLFCPSYLVAEPLGRLFYTEEERVSLERLRWASPEELSVMQEQHEVILPERPTQPEKPPFVTLGGTMTRSDGRQIVWLNGVSYDRSQLPENVRVRQPFTAGQIDLRLPEKGKTHSLRPGQTLDVDSGQIHESYQRPATAVHEGDSAPDDSNQLPVAEAPLDHSIPPLPAKTSPVQGAVL